MPVHTIDFDGEAIRFDTALLQRVLVVPDGYEVRVVDLGGEGRRPFTWTGRAGSTVHYKPDPLDGSPLAVHTTVDIAGMLEIIPACVLNGPITVPDGYVFEFRREDGSYEVGGAGAVLLRREGSGSTPAALVIVPATP